MSEELDEELGEIIRGLKRTVSERKQAGKGNVEPGKHEMTFELYKKFMFWFMKISKLIKSKNSIYYLNPKKNIFLENIFIVSYFGSSIKRANHKKIYSN